MGTRRKPAQPGRTRMALLTTAAAGSALLGSAGGAQAEPTADLATVKAQVDDLNEQAEASTEKYNKFKEDQQRLQKDAAQLQDQVAAAQEKMTGLRERLSAVAADQYRSGNVDPTVALMLSADPSKYLQRASAQDIAASSQSDLLHLLQEQQRRLDQRRAEATTVLAQLDQADRALSAEKKQVQSRLSEATRLLNTLSAADRAKVNGQDPRSSRASARETYTGPATGRAAAAVQFAYAQLGKPYEWGATGPGTFDCSGLTGGAWRAAGVSLPRVSQDQWNAGQHVSKANLQPGDLVFFYSDLHHVGIYIGGGKMIHAPRTGKNIEITPIEYMPYMGAVRP
ncbi:NlpC/P60 family protein [Kitasatospora sp. NPDC085879]|uniref:C40 family peptidase n=1 Tax=Kitasatospora sp. NPDC085879 TaxID=3154769 RepID=UPI00343FA83F